MNQYYPIDDVKIKMSVAENLIPNFITTIDQKPKVYFEIGSNIGSTCTKVKKVLPPNSKMYLFDFIDNKKYIEHLIDNNTFFFGSESDKVYDSYNWYLMQLYIDGVRPNFVFIDGKHTFDVDWLCFFLIDQMLTSNGYIYFDDYEWSLENSPAMNPKKFPSILDQYSQDQIKSQHIKILIDNIVSKIYKCIIPHKLYQKIN
jgi:hypothetical protein